MTTMSAPIATEPSGCLTSEAAPSPSTLQAETRGAAGELCSTVASAPVGVKRRASGSDCGAAYTTASFDTGSGTVDEGTSTGTSVSVAPLLSVSVNPPPAGPASTAGTRVTLRCTTIRGLAA